MRVCDGGNHPARPERTTWESNPAIRLYRQQGYIVRDTGDAITMRLGLHTK